MLDRDDLLIDAPARLRTHPGTLELEWRRGGGKLYLGALGRKKRTLIDAQHGAAVTRLPQDA